MIKGIYRFTDNGYKKEFKNFITDKGYSFWTGSDPTLGDKHISDYVIGTSIEGVTDMTPSSSLLNMQSSDLVQFDLNQSNNYDIIMNKTSNSAVITHRFNTFVNSILKVYELGLKLNSGELLSNTLIRNIEGTDVVPFLVNYETAEYDINIVIPNIIIEYSTTLSNNGDETTYKVTLELLDTLPSPKNEYSLKYPIKIIARAPNSLVAETSIDSKIVRLSSFDPETKTVIYNIVFSYNSEMINNAEAYNHIILTTSLGCYKVTLTEVTSETNIGFPDTNGQDLIIPFKLNL